MIFNVMIDGSIVKGYDNKKDAEEHATMINQQLLQYGKEAYVEDEIL